MHLECDLKTVVDWADANHRRWAFSLSNAGAYYVEFKKDLVNFPTKRHWRGKSRIEDIESGLTALV